MRESERERQRQRQRDRDRDIETEAERGRETDIETESEVEGRKKERGWERKYMCVRESHKLYPLVQVTLFPCTHALERVQLSTCMTGQWPEATPHKLTSDPTGRQQTPQFNGRPRSLLAQHTHTPFLPHQLFD